MSCKQLVDGFTLNLEAQAQRLVAMIFLVETIEIARRDMSLVQLSRAQMPHHLDVDALTAGDAEQPLGLARHRPYSLRVGIYQADARDARRFGTWNTTDRRGLLCLVQTFLEATISVCACTVRGDGGCDGCNRAGALRSARETMLDGCRPRRKFRLPGMRVRIGWGAWSDGHGCLSRFRRMLREESELQTLRVRPIVLRILPAGVRAQDQDQRQQMQRNRDADRDTSANVFLPDRTTSYRPYLDRQRISRTDVKKTSAPDQYVMLRPLLRGAAIRRNHDPIRRPSRSVTVPATMENQSLPGRRERNRMHNRACGVLRRARRAATTVAAFLGPASR
jgi:hypothetical protein